jgi:hypothetical protein
MTPQLSRRADSPVMTHLPHGAVHAQPDGGGGVRTWLDRLRYGDVTYLAHVEVSLHLAEQSEDSC